MSTVKTAAGAFVWHDHMSDDVAKATKFYSELLGWQTEIWKPGQFDYPMINANGKMHGGFGPAQGGAPAHWIGHVLVEDVDDTAAKAEAAGGTLLGEPMDIPEVGRMVFIRDPQGAVVSAFSPTGEASVPEGTFLWDELMTTDVAAAKSFYGEIFGWSATDQDMGEGTTYTLFQRAGEVNAAGCMAVPPGSEAPPHWNVYLATDNVDGTVARAKELGATVYVEPTDTPEVGRWAVLADPTGAAFALLQPAGS
jgi:predicted enzyme related to lactoylglutathione lyase